MGMPLQRAACALLPIACSRQPNGVCSNSTYTIAATAAMTNAPTGRPSTPAAPRVNSALPSTSTPIGLACDSTSASPRKMLIVPSVTMMLGRRSPTASRPLTSPHAVPVPTASSAAAATGTPSRKASAVTTPTTVTMEPTDRSISPIASSSTIPTAMIP
jgi:hypothetical protein